MTQTTLPLPLPTLPGRVDGIVGRDPWRMQCTACLAIEEPRPLVTMRTRFHPWPDGTNPRLCPTCRLARGCTCTFCTDERRNRP